MVRGDYERSVNDYEDRYEDNYLDHCDGSGDYHSEESEWQSDKEYPRSTHSNNARKPFIVNSKRNIPQYE